MADYFLWNGDRVIYSLGSLHLYWYALLIILSFILSIFSIKSLTVKNVIPVEISNKIQYLVLFVLLVALCFARWGEVIFIHPANLNQDTFSKLVPVIFKPTIRFVGLNQLLLPVGLLGTVAGAWLFNKLVFKGLDFLFILDRIAVAACLTGALLFTANFIDADFLGKPTDAGDGTVFIRPVTDGLAKLNCCIMRNPEGPNPLVSIKVNRGEARSMKETGQKNIVFTIAFKRDMEEREATEFIIGDIKSYLFEHPIFIKESGTEPIKYALSKMPDGTISATISTIGIARHPVQLYLALTCLVLFVVFYMYLRKNPDSLLKGKVAGWIMVLFSTVYFLIIFSTAMPAITPHYQGLVIHQWLILVPGLIGLALILSKLKRSKVISRI